MRKIYSVEVNYNLNIIFLINSSYFLLTFLLKNYRKNSKLVDSNTISQQLKSTDWSTYIVCRATQHLPHYLWEKCEKLKNRN